MKIHLLSELEEMINQGYVAAQRGDLIDADQVRARLEERKKAWLAEKRQR
jgi:hypothetical protein